MGRKTRPFSSEEVPAFVWRTVTPGYLEQKSLFQSVCLAGRPVFQLVIWREGRWSHHSPVGNLLAYVCNYVYIIYYKGTSHGARQANRTLPAGQLAGQFTCPRSSRACTPSTHRHNPTPRRNCNTTFLVRWVRGKEDEYEEYFRKGTVSQNSFLSPAGSWSRSEQKQKGTRVPFSKGDLEGALQAVAKDPLAPFQV